MPPKTRITTEMILNAAFGIVREQGLSHLSARSIAEALHCSTQPVLYAFSSMEEIRAAVYRMADEYHTARLMDIPPDAHPMLTLGLNYIRFAAEEKPLFRLLFQSGEFAGTPPTALMDAPELAPMLGMLSGSAGCTPEAARQIFFQLFLTVHGYASLLANNDMPYDSQETARVLKTAFMGALAAQKEENIHE